MGLDDWLAKSRCGRRTSGDRSQQSSTTIALQFLYGSFQPIHSVVERCDAPVRLDRRDRYQKASYAGRNSNIRYGIRDDRNQESKCGEERGRNESQQTPRRRGCHDQHTKYDRGGGNRQPLPMEPGTGIRHVLKCVQVPPGRRVDTNFTTKESGSK